MIFATVGMQLPFDRLMRALDLWCAGSGRSPDLFGQTGLLGPGDYVPRHFPHLPELDPRDFERRVNEADLLVSHAGMGTLITALMQGKPIILLPRRAGLGEQRNDHQIATAERFRGRRGVFVAMTEDELPDLLDRFVGHCPPFRCARPAPYAQDSLISAIRDEIFPGVAHPGDHPAISWPAPAGGAAWPLPASGPTEGPCPLPSPDSKGR